MTTLREKAERHELLMAGEPNEGQLREALELADEILRAKPASVEEFELQRRIFWRHADNWLEDAAQGGGDGRRRINQLVDAALAVPS